MSESFYNESELRTIGFRSLGRDLQISRYAKFYNPAAITIGSNVRIDDFCIVSGGAKIDIGDYVHIASYSSLFGGAGIVIQSFTNISSRVAIYSVSDDFSGETLTNPTVPTKYLSNLDSRPVTLEKHAIIGTNSTILPGVTVSQGTAVGAHSLVKHSTGPWTIVAGCPARKISERSRNLLKYEDDLIRKLESERQG